MRGIYLWMRYIHISRAYLLFDRSGSPPTTHDRYVSVPSYLDIFNILVFRATEYILQIQSIASLAVFPSTYMSGYIWLTGSNLDEIGVMDSGL